jgi:hypothetical protein
LVIDLAYLEWLRAETETLWRVHVPRDHVAAGVGGLDWQTGTRWRGGMTDTQISDAEARFGLVFPPDYRMFLSVLHTPDPPMVGAFFRGSALFPAEGRQMPDWTGDPESIEAAIEWPLRGLLASIEDVGWHATWGPRPNDPKEREARVRTLAGGGPQLIPVFGHRYLAGPPDRTGNPILSVYGSDVIILAAELGSWLPSELGIAQHPLSSANLESGAGIPFWGDVIAGLS